MRGTPLVRPFVKLLATALSGDERTLLRLLAASERDYAWCCWDGQRPAPARVLIIFCLAERAGCQLRITAHGCEVLAALPILQVQA